jgi:hypothetical protein
MARIQASPSQDFAGRWEVFCDGRLLGPSLTREQAFHLMQRLEAGDHCPPQPLTANR